MKKNILYGIISAFVMITFFSQGIKSQNADDTKITISGQWQFNAPVNNNYSDVASGWGANIEALYNIDKKWSAGAFMSWHTNNEYLPRQTYFGSTSAVNMDMQNSLYQLPFGLAGRYKFLNGKIEPYVGLKVGANYVKQRSYSNLFAWEDKSWGFFVSPEIGATIYPFRTRTVGFLVSGYYSYSTNKLSFFEQDGINNLGFRVGLVINM
ncbi:MAG: outer membrane beta-barrel protein [Dysgonomonas sp.]